MLLRDGRGGGEFNVKFVLTSTERYEISYLVYIKNDGTILLCFKVYLIYTFNILWYSL